MNPDFQLRDFGASAPVVSFRRKVSPARSRHPLTVASTFGAGAESLDPVVPVVVVGVFAVFFIGVAVGGSSAQPEATPASAGGFFDVASSFWKNPSASPPASTQ